MLVLPPTCMVLLSAEGSACHPVIPALQKARHPCSRAMLHDVTPNNDDIVCAGLKIGAHPCADRFQLDTAYNNSNATVSAVIVSRNDVFARFQMVWSGAVEKSLKRMLEQFDEVVLVDFNSVASGQARLTQSGTAFDACAPDSSSTATWPGNGRGNLQGDWQWLSGAAMANTSKF